MERKMRKIRARLDYWLKHNYIVNRIFNIVASFILRICGKFISIDNDMVLFSGHTRKYNDSPRAIYEYMINHSELKHLKMVWVLEDPEHTKLRGNPIRVKSDTWAYFKMALKAKYWIACVNIERSLHFKKKEQLYMNTWHGVSFNCIGNDAGGRKDYDWSNVDFCCYESNYHRSILKQALGVRDEAFIPTGLPRNDTLYTTTKAEIIELKKKMGLSLDKKIVMYAPTWRDSTDMGTTYEIKPPINVEYWEKELKENYILLLRTHAYTNKLLGIEFNDFILDFSSYPDINDIYKVSDILISDYSACIGDFSILERPIICFAYDLEIYRKKRGLYFDPGRDMPNGVQKDEHDVVELIKNMNYEEQSKKTRDMVKNVFTNIGGHATEACVHYMFGK
ncbi:CDP-glycerol glycerophosphotransferase family protein [Bacteroides cutis]|uniref:CDP-glycerol glycerophosphotransferase family protein n=1 Tax=Bacteroides cutis TaxID=2024197 RepID=UPI000C78E345|nr:CDP-glycerol glycerophosphotransferase family protein [Bacteroides cutis]